MSLVKKEAPTAVKKVYIGALPNNTTKEVPHGLTSQQASKIVRIWGVMWNEPGNIFPLPYVNTNADPNTASIYVQDQNLRVRTNTNYTAYTGVAYIEYELG